MTEITIPANTRASYLTVSRDTINEHNAALANLREDYTAQGETLEASKACVETLTAKCGKATRLIFTLRDTLRDTQISAAITSQALRAVRDQLKDAREEAEGLHGELRKCRTTAALDGARLAAVLDVLNAVAGIISSARIMGGISVMGTQDVRIGKLPYDELERAFLAYANAAQQEAKAS